MIRTCVTCRHSVVAGMAYGCNLSSRVDPVSGIEFVLPCAVRRADPMGLCGPAGKQWEEAQPEKPRAKRGRSQEQKPQGVTLQ